MYYKVANIFVDMDQLSTSLIRVRARSFCLSWCSYSEYCADDCNIFIFHFCWYVLFICHFVVLKWKNPESYSNIFGMIGLNGFFRFEGNFILMVLHAKCIICWVSHWILVRLTLGITYASVRRLNDNVQLNHGWQLMALVHIYGVWQLTLLVIWYLVHVR